MSSSCSKSGGADGGGNSSLVESSSLKQNIVAATYDMADAHYSFDNEELEKFRKSAPWKEDPKWFQSVAVSPSAIMKMMTHCQSGVDKGIRNGGNPIEVMGLLLGRPDPRSPHMLVVTDVFPIPCEGFETRVVADDVDVVNHMIALGESLETTRKEKFMGWYHSHPFDVGAHSHCYLSQTDISTQLQWQRAEDPHGNPFLAIVVDPLRSVASKDPQLRAFRAYPVDYHSPTSNECPDGSIVAEEQARIEIWGSCWNRYYELKLDYFMSRSARHVLEILNKNFLWMRTLGSSEGLSHPDPIAHVADQMSQAVQSSDDANPSSAIYHDMISSSRSNNNNNNKNNNNSSKDTESDISKACQSVVDLATERLNANLVQVVKQEIFS